MAWPTDTASLADAQRLLAGARPPPWEPVPGETAIGGVFVCFGRGGDGPGRRGDPGWAAAAVVQHGHIACTATVSGPAGGPYLSGFLALREGPLLEQAVRSLSIIPDVLLVNATGGDHPRRAGMAIHLGAILDIPTVGVTHRPLVAEGAWPDAPLGSVSVLRVGDEVAACWVRTIEAGRPLVVHAGWRTSLDAALLVVELALGGHRTPEPIREARRLARTSRHVAGRGT